MKSDLGRRKRNSDREGIQGIRKQREKKKVSKRELDVENDTFSKEVPVCTVNREEKVPEQLKIFRDDPGLLTPCYEKIEVISWPYTYSQVRVEIPITPAVTNLSQSCNTKQDNNKLQQ